MTNAGYVNSVSQVVNSGIGVGNDVKVAFSNETLIADKPDQLADRLNKLLLSGQMSGTLRKRVLDAVNSYQISPTDGVQASQARSNRVRAAVLIVMTSPEYLVQK